MDFCQGNPKRCCTSVTFPFLSHSFLVGAKTIYLLMALCKWNWGESVMLLWWPDFSLERHPYVTLGQGSRAVTSTKHTSIRDVTNDVKWVNAVAAAPPSTLVRRPPPPVVAQIQFSNCKVWHEGKKCISTSETMCICNQLTSFPFFATMCTTGWCSTLLQCLQIYLSYHQHCMQLQLLSKTTFCSISSEAKFLVKKTGLLAKSKNSGN